MIQTYVCLEDTTLIKNRTPTLDVSSQFNESIDHIRSIRMNPRTGPLVSIDRFVWSLEDVSFHNNLSPSTLDWSDPDIFGLMSDLVHYDLSNRCFGDKHLSQSTKRNDLLEIMICLSNRHSW